jgi:hypothetical protein
MLLAPLALGFTAGLIGQTVHMNADIFQSRPQVQLLWLVAALLVAMESVAQAGKTHLVGDRASAALAAESFVEERRRRPVGARSPFRGGAVG